MPGSLTLKELFALACLAAVEQGNGTVTQQRLYQLIRQPKPIADRQFEIEFLDPGAEAFSFTFG